MTNLTKLQGFRDESLEAHTPSIKETKIHKSYWRGDQLPQDVKEKLESRDQPLKWENIYKKLGSKILGLKLLNRQEMHVRPRQTIDKSVANLLKNILRTSIDSTTYYSHKKRADLDLMLSGLSIMEIIPRAIGFDELSKKQYEMIKRHVPVERCLTDPYAMQPDYSDAKYITTFSDIDKEELYALFDEEVVDKLEVLQAESTFRDRVRIYYTWYKEFNKQTKKFETRYAVWNDDVVLVDEISPYNFSNFPFAVRRLYDNEPDVHGYRGLFHDIQPIQDNINFKHLRIDNMLGTHKLLVQKDAVDDVEEFADEYSQDDAVVAVKNVTKIKEIKQNAEIAQMMNLIVDLRHQAEEVVGLNKEALGLAVNRMSGAAIENRQNAGMVGLQLFIDASNETDKDICQLEIEMVKQYVNAEQVYQMVDKQEADAYFIINQIQKDSNGVLKDENKQVKRKNRIDTGRFDVSLSTVPQSRGSIAERYKYWMELLKPMAGMNPQAYMEMMPLMLRDVESPVADEMIAVLKNIGESQGDSEGQKIQMQKMQLDFDMLNAKIAKLLSEVEVNKAKAKNENIVNNIAEDVDEKKQA